MSEEELEKTYCWMYTANCEIWRGKCNGVGMYFLRRNWSNYKMEGRMNGKDYSRLLSRHLLPYMQSSYVFMDDNAPCHQSQIAIRWIFKCFQTLGLYCIYMFVYHSTYVTFSLWPLAWAS